MIWRAARESRLLSSGLDDLGGGVSFAIAVVGEPGDDSAVLSDDKGSRVRDAGGSAAGGGVADLEGVDRPALRVGQKGVGDVAILGESFEDIDGIVADSDRLDSGFSERGKI